MAPLSSTRVGPGPVLTDAPGAPVRERRPAPPRGPGAEGEVGAAWPLRGLVGLPLAVLASSWAAVAWRAGSVWPWSAPVHEDGTRTFGDTILYFEHAARELPLDCVLALAVAGSFARCFPRPARGARRTARRAAIVLALGTVAILVGACAEGGVAALGSNLLQGHTRPGEGLEWGAHWRYHLLSRLALMALAHGGIAWVAARRTSELGSARLLRAAWGSFALLTLVFLPTAEPFVDARFLGHQARELMTHTLVTLPLCLAACAAAALPRAVGPPTRSRAGLAALGLAVALGAWLAGGVLWTGASSQGQSSDPVALLAAHVFEHSLGYMVAPALAALAYARFAGARAPG